MKLWHLYRTKGIIGWDEADSFVVRASNEGKARMLAAAEAGDEKADTWLSAKLSKCEPLPAAGTAEVVIRSFNAG